MLHKTTPAQEAVRQPPLGALTPVSVRDESDFWKVVAEYPGRGMSQVTIARHTLPNGVVVSQRYYQPGPYDALAFGEAHALAQPASTYTVYTGVHGQPDELSDADAIALLRQAHPNLDEAAMAAGSLDIWSPDGEGAVFWKFRDLQVEDALNFARSLDPQLVLETA